MLKLVLDHLDFELLGTSIALESKNELPDPDLVQLEIVWTAMEKISNERKIEKMYSESSARVPDETSGMSCLP